MSALKRYGGFFDFESKQQRKIQIDRQLELPETWSNVEKSQQLNQERALLERTLSPLSTLSQNAADALELAQLLSEEDAESLAELAAELSAISQSLDKLELTSFFSGESDSANAFLDIKPGSGGTEAQDWADMLFKMYDHWAAKKGFKVEVVDYAVGDVAGLKSATLKLIGEYAFGWARTESGVHRLVRKSPFDSGARRHTSFASVYAYPEIDNKIEVEVDTSDLRIDTYRASGAGGQHVNRTDSAVRITHIPTGVVVQCQNERSQHRNKAEAMSMLRARLYERERQKQQAEMAQKEGEKPDISWGSQIRSYVLDQSRIKDHRTNVEVGNVNAVLLGELDSFIEASLKAGL